MAETTTTTFDAAAYTANGTARERVPLPPALFDGTVNMPVMHQAVKAYLANQRQGNASTKTRGLVTGGNQKPWRQKGTGRARQGSIRAPHWVGGGTVFGPTPRSYAEYVPKQVRALARKSAFNARAREGAVLVIDQLNYDAPKTSRVVALIESLGLGDEKVLILTDGVKPNVFLSARNIPSVHVMPYADVSAYHILWSDVVVMEASALGHVLEPIAEVEPAPEPGEGEAKPARRAAKKKTTKKAAAKRGATAKRASAAKGDAGAAKKKTAAKKSTRSATKPKKKEK